MEDYYNSKYFNQYQKKIGEFGGIANSFKFKKYINDENSILDFGCGGGFLLNNLKAKSKLGIEINPVARNYCMNEFKINCYDSLDKVKDNSIDIIISNHALEHTTNPNLIISSLYKKLKKNGKIVVVVPLDSFLYKYKKNDVNKHLFSFSPMNLGNLFSANKFIVLKTGIIFHKWPPFWFQIKYFLGWKIFHLISKIYGILNLYWVQSYIVCKK